MNFENLSYDIIYLILINSSIKVIDYWCQTNMYIYNICQDEGFWRDKVLHNFNISFKPEYYTWKELYYNLAFNRIKIISVIFNNKMKYMLIKNNDIIKSILDHIKDVFNITNNVKYIFMDDNRIIYRIDPIVLSYMKQRDVLNFYRSTLVDLKLWNDLKSIVVLNINVPSDLKDIIKYLNI